MANMLEWAKRYIEIGWSVIPIKKDSKIPAIPEVIPYRTRYATENELSDWFGKDNNIAVITGKLSGIIVIDDDSMRKTGLSSEYLENVRSSVVSKTGGGGKHYFCKYEEGFGNQVNIAGESIDIRSEGGYVIIPESVIKGGKYEWVSPPTKENLEKMPRFSTTPEIVGKKRKEIKTISDYLFVGTGARNDSLFKMSCRLLKEMTQAEVFKFIEGANQTYTPPLPQHDLEILFKSALRYYKADGKLTDPRFLAEIYANRLTEREFEKDAPHTGYKKLNSLISGFVPGRLYTMSAETNSGKTTLAANFAVNLSKQGKKVLYIALEPGNAIMDVLASCYYKKPYKLITNEVLKTFVQEEKNIRVYVDREITKVEDLIVVVQKNISRYDLIIIDHIGYFVQNEHNYIQKQANILKELRFLTKEQRIAILVVAHLRKRGEGKRKTIPSMDDISGSGAFKQDSTDVLLLVRESKENDDFNIEYTSKGWILVAKTKATMGRPGSVTMTFHDADEDKSAVIEEEEDLLEGLSL